MKIARTLVEVLLVMGVMFFIILEFAKFAASKFPTDSYIPSIMTFIVLVIVVFGGFELWSRVKGNGPFWSDFL